MYFVCLWQLVLDSDENIPVCVPHGLNNLFSLGFVMRPFFKGVFSETERQFSGSLIANGISNLFDVKSPVDY
jgi:hypothetical protein